MEGQNEARGHFLPGSRRDGEPGVPKRLKPSDLQVPGRIVNPPDFSSAAACNLALVGQIDPAAARIPIAEFFGQHGKLIAQDGDMRAQKPLEIVALAHLEIANDALLIGRKALESFRIAAW